MSISRVFWFFSFIPDLFSSLAKQGNANNLISSQSPIIIPYLTL